MVRSHLRMKCGPKIQNLKWRALRKCNDTCRVTKSNSKRFLLFAHSAVQRSPSSIFRISCNPSRFHEICRLADLKLTCCRFFRRCSDLGFENGSSLLHFSTRRRTPLVPDPVPVYHYRTHPIPDPDPLPNSA